MTTVVCDLEGIAADMRIVGGGPMFPVKKIHRVGNSLLGLAGDMMMAKYFVEWFSSARRNPATLHKAVDYENRSQIDIIELNPGGIYYWNCWGVSVRVEDNKFAIGSGAPVALAALDQGKSLEDAVLAAMKWDESVGHGVQVEYLIPPELLKPPRKRRIRK